MENRIEKLKDFLSLTPDDEFIQHALALEHLKIGEYEEARRLFENVLIKNPGYIGSYYHLGKLLEQNGKKEEALKWYMQGLIQAREAGDQHAYSELLAAKDDLSD